MSSALTALAATNSSSCRAPGHLAYRHPRHLSLRSLCTPNLTHSQRPRRTDFIHGLLAYGDEPLVLDQPEDDLDNHLIYDLVVRQIRENKLRRQIIVVTHNPNIVVNGDAEMLHVMEFTAGQCTVSRSGSLQDQEIRDEICSVMEGGREAFESRYRRLGPESAGV